MSNVTDWKKFFDLELRIYRRLRLLDFTIAGFPIEWVSSIIYMLSERPDEPYRFNIVCFDDVGRGFDVLEQHLASLDIRGEEILTFKRPASISDIEPEIETFSQKSPFIVVIWGSRWSPPVDCTTLLYPGSIQERLVERTQQYFEMLKMLSLSSNFRGLLVVGYEPDHELMLLA